MFYNSDVVGPIKQEFVPPASVAICGEWDLSARGCLPKGGLPRGCLPWGVHARGGVCPGGCVCHTRPPTCGQTDACENITLLEASFAGGKYLPTRSGKSGKREIGTTQPQVGRQKAIPQ